MKVLTLHQPYASLIPLGPKRTETRSWATSYRGPLAIHAAASIPTAILSANLGKYEIEKDNPRGTSYASWCSHCGEARELHVPCVLDDFILQIKAFAKGHEHCRVKEEVSG